MQHNSAVEAIKRDWNEFGASVDWAYDTLTVPLSAGLIVLYAAPLPEWRAYALVPMACVLLPLLLCELGLFCHRRGLLRWVYHTVHDFLSGALVAVLLNIERLRQSKPGQLALWLALANLSMVVYWLYKTIDVLRLGKDLFNMLYTLVTALGDPVALLRSFQATLRTLSSYTAAEEVRQYVNMSVTAIDGGSTSVLLQIVLVTLFLVLVAVVFYWVGHAWNRACERLAEQRAKAQPLTPRQ